MKSSDSLKEMILEVGIAKIDGQDVINDIEVRKLIDSGLVKLSGRATLPDILLVLWVPDEELCILKDIYEKGEICVSEVVGKIRLSRIKKWIDSGLVGMEKRQGKIYLKKI